MGLQSYQENKLPPSAKKPIALDTELFGMEKRRLHRATGSFASLALWDGRAYLITDESMIPAVLNRIKDRMWIFHNAGFDLFHLRRWADIPLRSHDMLWDTMIMERLLWSGFYTEFSLAALTRRYLNKWMDKSTRKAFEKASVMTNDMKDYAVDDVVSTGQIKQGQVRALKNHPNSVQIKALWQNIEAPMIELVPQFRGFKVNQNAWHKMADKHDAEKNRLKQSMSINPASPIQVKKALYTFGVRARNTQANTLTDLLSMTYVTPRARALIQDVLTYRKVAKLANTYGHKFLENHLEADGRVYSHYWTIGAATGRMASADPNMQNIPSAKEYRSCFVAGKGMKLIVADYSQQETRILAHISQDDTLLKIFSSGGDPHLRVARKVFRDLTITKDDIRRFYGKTIDLALPYGLTATGLAGHANVTVDEAEIMLRDYFREFRGVEEYMKHYRWLGSTNGYVETVGGRVTWINLYSKQWQNIVINAPIQGGAAGQIKLALVLLAKKCIKIGLDFFVVAVVHDEIVSEVPVNKVTIAKTLVRDAMIDAGEIMFPRVKWKVGVKVGKTWGIKG